jgi:hypothetical protein
MRQAQLLDEAVALTIDVQRHDEQLLVQTSWFETSSCS